MRDTETSVKSETTEVRKVDCAVVVLESKNNEKILRKPLDKIHILCYNKTIIKKEVTDMTIKKLSAMPYAQAFVEITDDGTACLFSYNTLVASISPDGWCCCYTLYSQTTRKHISAFADEYTSCLNYSDFKKAYSEEYIINHHTGEIQMIADLFSDELND